MNAAAPHRETFQDIPRRATASVLLPGLEACQPSGVDIGAGSRVIVVSSRRGAGAALVGRLQARGAVVFQLAGLSVEQLGQAAGRIAAEGGVQGVYFLVGLEREPVAPQMGGRCWREALEARTEGLFRLMKALPGEPFLVCATHLGGWGGQERGRFPMGGAIAGFCKALAQERPAALVKVVNFAPRIAALRVAETLLAETLHDPASVEVGWRGGQRYALQLREQPPGVTDFPLSHETVYLVSGGTGGIVTRILGEIVRAHGGRFYLLSRQDLTALDEADCQALQVDRVDFRLQLARRMRAAGERVTPAMVEARLAAFERWAAAAALIAEARALGATVELLVCDVRDAQACRQAVRTVLAREGRIDVFLHAAGVEVSRKLERKPLEEFRQTMAVKVGGFVWLFAAMRRAQQLPRAVLFFSSLAGRFGLSGQTDYACANDLLDQLAWSLPQFYPGMKCRAIQWGPWAAVGMASRGSVPEWMQRAGIDMLDPAAATPHGLAELTSGQREGEVLLAGALGALERFQRPVERLAESGWGRALHRATFFQGTPGFTPSAGLSLPGVLDPQREPYLRDHALNGISLLPGVMGLEGLASAAQALWRLAGGSASAGTVQAIEQASFDAPLKFYRDLPRAVTWHASGVAEEGGLVFETRLSAPLQRYGRPTQEVEHFRARVHLGREGADPPSQGRTCAPWDAAGVFTGGAIYRLYFHGPAFQVLAGVLAAEGAFLGRWQSGMPRLTRRGERLATTPRLVELCLQTAGIWEMATTGILALPRAIERLVFYGVPAPETTLTAVVHPQRDAAGLRFDAQVLDEAGRVWLLMENYRTVALPYALEAEQLAPLRTWMARMGQP